MMEMTGEGPWKKKPKKEKEKEDEDENESLDGGTIKPDRKK